MPQATWTGAITFGLVTVPVSLFAATSQHSGPALHQVHRKDGARIRLKRICEEEGKEVPYREIAKGYESPDGRTVVLEDQDFAELPVPSRKVIDVLAFVDAESVDPVRYSTPYYVGPAEKSPVKPYQLLRDALVESGRMAVAKVTLRTRESLAVLRVQGDLLVLQTMLWPDEIRDPAGIAPGGKDQVRPQELKMARSLMDTLSEGFDLDEQYDEYAEALERVITAKLEGVEPPTEEEGAERAGGAQVIDLMDALRSSVEAARGGRGGEGEADSKEAPARKSAAEKASEARASSRKSTGTKRAPAKKTAGEKSASEKTAGGKSASGKPAAKKTAAKKTTTGRSPAKKTAAKKTAAKSSRRRAS
ncbi:non-homologous end joining protein Ku [Phaeacidiphilus oryzae]|uniref:non-homologous end joining protein Ku n=1 Tax=Phaeacidiphilus oryzae TaxID=348818 RepID=UPI00055E3EA8|nr:Ku protein [Phaeacidiphilus oryzae]